VLSNGRGMIFFLRASARILEATQQPSAQATSSQRIEVIQTLANIPNGDPETVLAKAKVLFDQEGWVVHGGTYQVGRDVNITNVTSSLSQTSRLADSSCLASSSSEWPSI